MGDLPCVPRPDIRESSTQDVAAKLNANFPHLPQHPRQTAQFQQPSYYPKRLSRRPRGNIPDEGASMASSLSVRDAITGDAKTTLAKGMAAGRVVSLDIMRGLVMVIMA